MFKHSARAIFMLLMAAFVHAQQTPQEPLANDFDSLDEDGDGTVTRAEADDKNVQNHFDAIDKNKNDVLSRDEFVTYIAEENPLLGEELAAQELPQAYLRERTQDNGDVVTNPELLPKIDTDFESLDENKDGYITREEAGDENVQDHFNHADDNADGRITLGEFNNYLYEYGTVVASEELVERFER